MDNFDLKKYLAEGRLFEGPLDVKYDEDGMIRDAEAKAVELGPIYQAEEGKEVMIPIDFIGFRSNEESAKRDDGSFSVTVFAKRSDNKKLGGLDKFQITAYVDKDFEDAGQIFYPNFNEYRTKIDKIEKREDFFKYIKDNLLRIKNKGKLNEQMYIDDEEFEMEMGRSKKDSLKKEMIFHVDQLMDGNIDMNDFMNVVEDIMSELK